MRGAFFLHIFIEQFAFFIAFHRIQQIVYKMLTAIFVYRNELAVYNKINLII